MEDGEAIVAAGMAKLVYSLADHTLQGRKEAMLSQEVQGTMGFPEWTIGRQVEGCWLVQQ